MENERRLISCCGGCIYYSNKRNKCTICNCEESNHRYPFYDDCPLPKGVEVVYCKNCNHYEKHSPESNFGYCYHWDYEQGMSPNQVDEDDFCSYGEKREVE